MKNSTTIIFIGLVAVAVISSCSATKSKQVKNLKGYTPVSMELYQAIAHMDSVLFDAFNGRDLEKLKTIFSTDVEFYHDKGGLTHYDQVMESSKNLFEQNNGLTRTLIPGSLEVYPVKDYGAIQIGMHRFCHQENGKDDCGTFKFVHVWRQHAGVWNLARVISYDH